MAQADCDAVVRLKKKKMNEWILFLYLDIV